MRKTGGNLSVINSMIVDIKNTISKDIDSKDQSKNHPLLAVYHLNDSEYAEVCSFWNESNTKN